MTLVVYGRATSSNVQAVMWTLAELGLDARRIDLGGRHGGLDTPEFRAMNPSGLIPVLKDGADAPIFESAAIVRYLGARYGAAPFWPQDPAARAQVDAWAEWGKSSFARAFTVPVFWAHWRTPPGERDHTAIASATRNFESLMAIAAPRIEAHGFVAGPDLTVADIWVGHVLYRYFTLDIARIPHPAFVDYYDRLTARPDYRAHVMIDYSELKAVAR